MALVQITRPMVPLRVSKSAQSHFLNTRFFILDNSGWEDLYIPLDYMVLKWRTGT